MRVWWCESHLASGYNDEMSGKCWLDDLGGGDPHDYKPCRMVPMRLIPYDAEELLHGLVRSWNHDLNDFAVRAFAKDILDALAGQESS